MQNKIGTSLPQEGKSAELSSPGAKVSKEDKKEKGGPDGKGIFLLSEKVRTPGALP